MKANVKGFIRNVVGSVLDELVSQELLYDEYGIAIEDGDKEFSHILEVAAEITENHLDCIEEE